MRFKFIAGLALAMLPALVTPASAADKVNVGVLRFVSSGGLFLAQERGYFKDAGLDVNFKYFQAAQPIAVAIASGDLDFGATAITAGTYNLAGKGVLKIIASQGAERKGYDGTTVLASNAAYKRGVTGFEKLAGTSVAVTQIGSSQHYMFGQIAEAEHIDLAKNNIKPLQGIASMVAAIKTSQVDVTLLPPQFAQPLVKAGDAHSLGLFSQIADYQYGALFSSVKMVTDHKDWVKRFVAAYQHGCSDYAKAFLQKDSSGKPIVNDDTKAAAALIAKYVFIGLPPDVATDKIIHSAVFVDASGKINLADIERQIAWYKSLKLVNPDVDAKTFVDQEFTK